MAIHFDFVRIPQQDATLPCPHCKASHRMEALQIERSTLLGRFFVGLSPGSPCFSCTSCRKLCQKLPQGSRAMVVATWLPGALFGGYLLVLVSGERTPGGLTPYAQLMMWIGIGLIAVTLYALARTLRSPLYPVAGKAVEEGGRLTWAK